MNAALKARSIMCLRRNENDLSRTERGAKNAALGEMMAPRHCAMIDGFVVPKNLV